MKHIRCLICEGQRLQALKGYYDRHGLVRCTNCGFVFMEAVPTVDELNAYYKEYSYAGAGYLSPITVKVYQQLLDEFEPYRKSNKLLDVGCGRGWFLDEAKKRGWQVFGTEYSETAVQLCSDKGIEMRQGALDPGMFDFRDFDVITSFEVMEHINNPNEEVRSIASLLRKGGLFYATTPNFDSLMRRYLKADYNVIAYPEHLSYYTKATLTRLAEKHQLRKRKFLSTGISISRLQASRQEDGQTDMSSTSADERLRQDIESKWYLGVAKRLANSFLTLTNSGLTLKGYYVKE